MTTPAMGGPATSAAPPTSGIVAPVLNNPAGPRMRRIPPHEIANASA